MASDGVKRVQKALQECLPQAGPKAPNHEQIYVDVPANAKTITCNRSRAGGLPTPSHALAYPIRQVWIEKAKRQYEQQSHAWLRTRRNYNTTILGAAQFTSEYVGPAATEPQLNEKLSIQTSGKGNFMITIYDKAMRRRHNQAPAEEQARARNTPAPAEEQARARTSFFLYRFRVLHHQTRNPQQCFHRPIWNLNLPRHDAVDLAMSHSVHVAFYLWLLL